MISMEKELVSVIIPCFNQGEYIEETLQSVLAQTYSFIEIIIVNDGSTDDSDNVIKTLIEKYSNIKYLHLENGGVSKARNIGIEAASGRYILPLDADDLINPEYINLCIKEFRKDADLIVVTGQGRFFGIEEGPWNLEEYSVKKMLHGNVIYCPSLFKKEDWEKIGGFDETLDHLEDWEFYIRLTFLSPKKIKRIDYVGLLYRIKGEDARNTIGFAKLDKYHETALYIYNKHKDLFLEHYPNPLNLIKENESLKWELKRNLREINYLNGFFFMKIINKLRKIKNG